MDVSVWVDTLNAGFAGVMNQVIGYLPRVLAAAAVLTLGWLLARVLRALSVRLVTGLDRLWQRFVVRGRLERLQRRHPPTRVVGELVFWLVMLFFLVAVSQILGLEIFVTWLAQVVAYLPLLVAGLLIVLAGLVVSSLTRDVVTAAASSAGIARGELLGRTAQGVILLIAVVIGVAQIGIDVSFISVIASIVLASILGGLGLAFGIGARTYVANVLASHQLRRLYAPGDTVRVRGVEGKILEITATVIVLEGEEGRIAVPALVFAEEVSILASREPTDASG